MLDAMDRIASYIAGGSFESFRDDPMMSDAVVRNLEIIGEAANRLPPEVRERHPEAPWSEMRGLRNILAHEYFAVDLAIIWKTANSLLPELKTSLERMRMTENDRDPTSF